MERLKVDSELLTHAAIEARDAAIHEESKAEDKYDTRGLEASYLAGAQAKRAAELQQLIQFYKFLQIQDFSDDAPIAATALVEMEFSKKKSLFFMVPKGGGDAIEVDGKTVQIITPVSRLGAELLGRTAGDEFEVETAGQVREYKILSVS